MFLLFNTPNWNADLEFACNFCGAVYFWIFLTVTQIREMSHATFALDARIFRFLRQKNYTSAPFVDWGGRLRWQMIIAQATKPFPEGVLSHLPALKCSISAGNFDNNERWFPDISQPYATYCLKILLKLHILVCFVTSTGSFMQTISHIGKTQCTQLEKAVFQTTCVCIEN